ncbi:hypothetical protein RF11_10883 [Thelohanellus kitauei]|uniref:Uncharacterized protein n=1 Tax=Thelohanellus kitauei TaxID=669202 RepID=A0A0C2M182_THEKT|nr:hypothetical protein RF11_10883 [Thelohanellus kitauei]
MERCSSLNHLKRIKRIIYTEEHDIQSIKTDAYELANSDIFFEIYAHLCDIICPLSRHAETACRSVMLSHILLEVYHTGCTLQGQSSKTTEMHSLSSLRMYLQRLKRSWLSINHVLLFQTEIGDITKFMYELLKYVSKKDSIIQADQIVIKLVDDQICQ